MGLFGRQGNPEGDLAKALAKRGTQGRATVVSMRETGNERDGIAKETPARVVYDREDSQKLMVEGHVRYPTDVVGGEIVVVEVEDVR